MTKCMILMSMLSLATPLSGSFVVTSGYVEMWTSNRGDLIQRFMLSGPGLRVSYDEINAGPTLFVPNLVPSCTATCNYNFSQIMHLPISGRTNWTLDSVPYRQALGFNVDVTMTMSSVNESATAVYIPTFGLERYVTAWPAVPFLMTGTIAVSDPGGRVVATEVISGSGWAFATAEDAVRRDVFSEHHVRYDFGVPEPTTTALLAGGLLLLGLRRIFAGSVRTRT